MTAKQIEKELERQKVLFEEEIRSGICPDDKTRLVDFNKRWMEEYGKVNLAIKTYSRYQYYIDRIDAALGHLRLKDITPIQINRFLRSLEADGVSRKIRKDENGNLVSGGKLAPKTIADHHKVLSKVLSTAVKWGLIEKNPASRADPPKVPYREMKYLNVEETKLMLTLLNKEPIQYRTMIYLAVYTGLRRGELCGLEWKDIDLGNQIMWIRRSSQYIGNATIITKSPKTEAGVRQFALSESVCSLLREHRKWQREQRLMCGDLWQDKDRLFTQWNGEPTYPDTISDWFQKFLVRSGLPKVTLHSLRHTNATLMIAEGTDVCTVSKRLGHANTATTLNIYAHALKTKDQEAANNIERVLANYA